MGRWRKHKGSPTLAKMGVKEFKLTVDMQSQITGKRKQKQVEQNVEMDGDDFQSLAMANATSVSSLHVVLGSPIKERGLVNKMRSPANRIEGLAKTDVKGLANRSEGSGQ